MLALPATAEAKLPLLRVWGQAHGTWMTGQGIWFEDADGPRLGWGGQAGVGVLIFEAFLDVNVFQLSRRDGEPAQAMWNTLGAGLNAPFDIGDSGARLSARANVGYTFAPYLSAGNAQSGGLQLGAGLDVDYFFTKVLAVGVSNELGFHRFEINESSRNNGVDWTTQLRFRIELGI